MKKLLIALLTIIIPISIYGETTELEWENEIASNEGSEYYSAIETEDGGYWVLGQDIIDDTSVRTYDYNATISKYTKDGKVAWKKFWGGTNMDYFLSSVRLNDGNYMIVGYTVSAINQSDNGGKLLKYDKDGTLLFQKDYGNTAFDALNSIVLSPDNNVVAVGSRKLENIEGFTNKGENDAVISKFDLSGNVIWQKNYGGSAYDYFNSVIAVNGGYIAVGNSTSTDVEGLTNKGNADALIVKYDLDGNVLWEKNYGGSADDYFNSVIQVTDGYIVVGESTSTDIAGLTNKGNTDAIIVKFDSSGNIVWQKFWGGNNSDSFKSIISVNNGYIAVGEFASDNIEGISNYYGDKNAILVKFNLTGNVLSQENYGGSCSDKFNSISSVNDGYIITGHYCDLAVILKYMTKYDIVVEGQNGNALSNVNTSTKDNVITLTLTPDPGKELESIKIIRTSDNKDVTSEINYNKKNNTFIMPGYDIKINAVFGIINPNTFDMSFAKWLFVSFIGIAGIIGIAFMTFISKKSIL